MRDEDQRSVQNSTVSRRAFMAGAGALGAATALGPNPAAAQAAQPKRGGRMRMALAGGGPSDTLDPATIIDAWQQNISYQCRNTLVELLPTLQPGPELAESWEASPDAKVWRFKIRQGVQFHNGKTMTLDDVMYSLNYHRGPNTRSGAAGLLRAVTDLKADGKDTLVFTLSGGNADFPVVLTDYHFLVVPDGTPAADMNKGMGTGPYALQAFEPGVRGFSKRNPNYWRSDRAFFDEVETLNVNDTSARTNALISGQADLINRVDLRTANLLERNPALKMTNVVGFKHLTFSMLCDTPPYNNLDVRLALKWAMNRKQIVEKVLHGYGVTGNDSPLTPFHRYYNAKHAQHEYDPDKVKFHLKKAGMENQVFELHTAEVGFDGAVDASILYQADAAKAGLNIKITRAPYDGYFKNTWKKVPFCTSYWASRASEDAIYTLAYSAGSNFNDTNWANPRFNELLVAARAELDPAKRGPMYAEMQTILWEDGGQIVSCWVNHVGATSNKVRQHDKISGANENDGHRNAERWWFA